MTGRTRGQAVCRTLSIALCLAHPTSTIAAQERTAAGTIRGQLVEASGGAAISGAVVALEGLGLQQYTDSAGRFVFVSVPIGRRVVVARRLGYLPITDTIAVTLSDTAMHRLALRRTAVMLNEITIAGRAYQYPPFFADAYKRAARGRGVFFTREDIAQLNAKDYETLLNRIPGVSANSRGVTFNRCQTGLELTRSNKRFTPKVQIWIDGNRVMNSGDTTDIYTVIGSVKPHMIQIMEVYPNVVSIPGEFLADACAVIVIWTKRD